MEAGPPDRQGAGVVKGGRLKIVNESSYPTAEVEALVRFGLQEIDLKGSGLALVVQNTKRSDRRRHGYIEFSGHAWPWIEDEHRKYVAGRKGRWRVAFVRVSPNPRSFPFEPFKRNGIVHDWTSWQEAVVFVTAHEGKHIEHYHQGAYRTKSGHRKAATFTDPRTGRQIQFRRAAAVRTGSERIEPKCDAHAQLILRRFRATVASVDCEDQSEGALR